MLQRETWWDIASFLLRSLLTLIAAVILVLEANGYVVDFNRLRIEKAGLLVIEVTPATATVRLDDKELSLQRGKLTKQYFPDQYQLEVSKLGYQTWHHQADIKKGHVALFNDITLFPTKLKVLDTHPVTLAEQQTLLVDNQLRILDTELWHRTKDAEQLITRLSVPMIGAILFDPSHALYETSTGIHVIDIDGSNDQLLLSDDFAKPAPLIITDSGRTLSVVGEQITTNYRLQ